MEETDTPEKVLDRMRNDDGIGGMIIRKDGKVLNSTVAVNEIGAGMISSLANITDAMAKKISDEQKEVEITFKNLIIIMIPINEYYFCGMVKEREQKKQVRKYAEEAKGLL